MGVEARAPARVDLAGGTVDTWPLYLFHPRVQTVKPVCYAGIARMHRRQSFHDMVEFMFRFAVSKRVCWRTR
jgi:hypothetical protein